jgi:hypothetical protein
MEMNTLVLVDLHRRDHLSIKLNDFEFVEALSHIWRIFFKNWFPISIYWPIIVIKSI